MADKMGVTVEEAALGIIRIVNANMVKGISGNSVERGYDLREFALVTMGGAAALHAADIARELSMARVIVPPMSGNFSAVGLVVADIQHDYVRTYARKAPDIDPAHLAATFREMEDTGLQQLAEEKISQYTLEIIWSADLRYEGQSWELNTIIERSEQLNEESIRMITEDFHKLHMQVYSYAEPDEVVEFINLRVRVLGKNPTLSLPKEREGGDKAAPQSKEIRRVYLEQVGWREIPVYERDRLPVGAKIAGPSIVEEQISTTLIPQGYAGSIDVYRNIIIEPEG